MTEYKYPKFPIIFGVLICLFVNRFIVLTSRNAPVEINSSYDENNNERELALFERVVDGDTIVVLLNGEDVKIRFIGIDTPESVASDDSRNCDEGREASNYTKSLFMPGESVFLEYDEEKTDKYGRTLAYVYFHDGTMIQDVLLSEGYAKLYTVWPNTMYAEHFEEIQNEAQIQCKGFWANYYTY